MVVNKSQTPLLFIQRTYSDRCKSSNYLRFCKTNEGVFDISIEVIYVISNRQYLPIYVAENNCISRTSPIGKQEESQLTSR